MMNSDLFENLRLELRRGCLVLAVLAQLQTEHYGYTLRKALGAQRIAIDEGTLYPLLRRLESQGLLVSEWREEERRNKRFYRLSEEAAPILKQLVEEWEALNSSINRILLSVQREPEVETTTCASNVVNQTARNLL
jgi:PadR family transcriptional regulator PadR